MVTSTIPKLIAAFILVVVGAIFVTVVAQQTNTITNPTYVNDEPLSIASARLAGNNINTSINFTLANPGLIDAGGWVTNSVNITNATGASLVGNYTVDYTYDVIRFSNNTYMVTGGGSLNTTLVDYSYYQSSYLQGFGNSVLGLISGFFAIAIMLVGVGLFYSVAKENGIL